MGKVSFGHQLCKDLFPSLESGKDQKKLPQIKAPTDHDSIDSLSLKQKIQILREQKLGRLTLIPTPDFLGPIHSDCRSSPLRSLLHLDYTASAQGLKFIERYISQCLETYANTHTETSATGRFSTIRFHQAIETVREHVQGGKDSFVIPCGYGATGAIERLQKILGLYLSPKGQKNVQKILKTDLKSKFEQKFVVFVGPSEHHSNDVTWQDAALCKFVRIKAIKDGPLKNHVDLDDLEKQLALYPHAIKMGSFSAASNVTGMKADLAAIGAVLKKHQAYFFVDYAASGPYADIRMEDHQIDAIFLSMHKNIGGTNLGILVGKSHIYDLSANPSFGGGGTVSAVTPWEYHFHAAIEEREYPGTPAIRQVWQAALSFEIKDWLGLENIDRIDNEFSSKVMEHLSAHPMIEVLGNQDPKVRYPIFSFLVKHGDKMLHHTLVAALLNDLFGIQARSGCACAGPFGHELLGIEKDQSDQYVDLILNVLNGFKPGWTRIGAHYTLSEEEIAYLLEAIKRVSYFGALFLDQYKLDPYSGAWTHLSNLDSPVDLSLEKALASLEGRQGMAELASEKDLYLSFETQLEEFNRLTAIKITSLIINVIEHLSLDDTDRLSAATLQVIDQFFKRTNHFSADEFIDSLTINLCPLIVPADQETASCKKRLRKIFNDQIFEPQNAKERFEDLSEDSKGADFFYVAKGCLSRPIEWDKMKKVEHCKPCASQT